MKFRPQVQLRFRDEGQYLEIKLKASMANESVNEWILLQLERETSGLVRKGKRQANGSKPDEVKSRGTSVGLGGNEPQQTVQGGGARGAGKPAPNKTALKQIDMKPSDALRAMRERNSK